MRHRVKKCNIPQYVLQNLTVSVLLYEKVSTTKTKAKAVKPIIDRLISKAKNENKVEAIRYLKKYLPDTLAVKKIMDELIGRYEKRTSGFTRIIATGYRQGDAAPMVSIQLTS